MISQDLMTMSGHDMRGNHERLPKRVVNSRDHDARRPVQRV
ncbi:hypothetical protein L485_03360 [Sphingobium baderi LL03]|uniref:Uncharacterized protein n=1 Tax=Sphingobium baderi LL03 TaxID=1114964 RepID=T0I0J3_9SPHN|nr:hypothetical protein L485_03360 [Sphingobium baderi LL03]